MHSPVTTIKERLSIEEVISSYLKLEPAGTNLKARCPFHGEKTPSFFVSPGRGSYYCFGCGASGDIFTFVEQFEGLDFKGALKLLADKAGVKLESYKGDGIDNSHKERLYQAMEEATLYFANNLKDNTEVLDYLAARGLNEKSLKEFRVGFAPNDWRLLYNHLKQKKFTDGEIEKAGLVKRSDKPTSGNGQGFYDRFRGRIMFPIADSTGRVIAFSGRLFEPVPTPEGVGRPTESVGPKYLNSPDTPIFSKFRVLYGLDKAKESIRKNNFSILVEGQMDLVLSHQAGFRNTVATSGTALSDVMMSSENVISNLGLIRRLSPNIVLAFDGDKAGFKAAQRAGKIALSLGMDVKVAALPEGVDPADIISKNGIEAWKSAIRGSKHIIEFLLNKVLVEAQSDTRKAGRLIKDTVLPYVSSLDSSIEQMHFIKKISDASFIKEDALKEDLKKIKEEVKREDKETWGVGEAVGPMYRKDYITRKIIGIIFWQETLPNKDINIQDIFKEFLDDLHITKEELVNKWETEKNNLIFEAEVFYGGGSDVKKDMKELLQNLHGETLKEELELKMHDLRAAEEAKDRDRIQRLMEEINEISKKVQNIKNNQIKNI